MIKLTDPVEICKTCNGWGELPGREGIPCSGCQGKAVFIAKGESKYVFDIPGFIDFGKRKKIKLAKGIISISVFLIIIAILVILLFAILQIF